jgi:hypothetical protein
VRARSPVGGVTGDRALMLEAAVSRRRRLARDESSHPASVVLRCPSMTIKARVTAGRLVVNEPTDLPEGTELELLPLDPGDWLDDADRAALHEALRQSDEDLAADRLVDASEILKELRSR